MSNPFEFDEMRPGEDDGAGEDPPEVELGGGAPPTPPTPPAAAAPPDPVVPPPAPRARSGKKKKRDRTPPDQTVVPPVEPRMAKLADPPDGLPKVTVTADPFDAIPGEVPRDPGSMWTILRNQWTDAGRNLDDLLLKVKRTKLDGRPLPVALPIPPHMMGSQLQGDNNFTPGEQLCEHIDLVCHQDMGPSTYKVEVQNRHTGKTVRVSDEYPLEAYRDVLKRRNEEANRRRQQLYGSASYGMPGGYASAPMPGRGGYPQPPSAVAPAAPAAPGAPPSPPAPAGPVWSAADAALHQELGYLRAVKDENDRARAEGRVPNHVPMPAAPPVAPPAPVGAPVDPDDAFFRRLEGMRRMGIIPPLAPPTAPVAPPAPPPPPPEDPDEAFMRKMRMMREWSAMMQPPTPPLTIESITAAVAATTRQTVIQMQEAGVIPKVNAAPPPAAPTGPAPDSFDAWRAARKRDKEYEQEFRRSFPDYVHKDEVEARRNVVDEEEGPKPSKEFPLSTYMGEPLRWVPWVGTEGGPESWGEWAARMASENPRRSGDLFGGVLKAAANVLPMDKLASLMEALTKRGGEAAAAVQGHQNGGGATATPGWSGAT